MSKKAKTVKFRKNFWQDWGEAILWAFVVAMIIRNYTFQNFKIPTSSMESTLLVGDYLVANKMKYMFTDPKRGDIVTFRNPDDPERPQPQDKYMRIIAPIYLYKDAKSVKNLFKWHEKKNVVKRVIGMPGDIVEIKNKIVHINGEPFSNDYEQYEDAHNTYPKNHFFYKNRDNMDPIEIPKGKYFVLGDNRDRSLDSRFWGFLDRKDVTGTPALIFFSMGNDWEIRWNRSFKIIK